MPSSYFLKVLFSPSLKNIYIFLVTYDYNFCKLSEFLPWKRIETLHFTVDAASFVKTTVNLKKWIWKEQMKENQRVSRQFNLEPSEFV